MMMLSGDWGFVRGRFWVVCEELLRHNAYSSIEEALNSSFPSKSDFYELSCSFLAFIFSDDSTSHVTNTMLRARLTNLHHNLESLVANIKCSLEPKVIRFSGSDDIVVTFCVYRSIWTSRRR